MTGIQVAKVERALTSGVPLTLNLRLYVALVEVRYTYKQIGTMETSPLNAFGSLISNCLKIISMFHSIERLHRVMV